MYLYMAVTEITVSIALLMEENSIQQPIFHVSKSPIEVEKRYPVEKLVLALVMAKRKLR